MPARWPICTAAQSSRSAPRDYAEDQVEAWAALAPSAAQIETRAADGRTTLVAVDDEDRPLAFGDLEHDGHIGLCIARRKRPARASPRRSTTCWSGPRASAA